MLSLACVKPSKLDKWIRRWKSSGAEVHVTVTVGVSSDSTERVSSGAGVQQTVGIEAWLPDPSSFGVARSAPAVTGHRGAIGMPGIVPPRPDPFAVSETFDATGLRTADVLERMAQADEERGRLDAELRTPGPQRKRAQNGVDDMEDEPS